MKNLKFIFYLILMFIIGCTKSPSILNTNPIVTKNSMIIRNDILFVIMQLPNDWKKGTDITCFIHEVDSNGVHTKNLAPYEIVKIDEKNCVSLKILGNNELSLLYIEASIIVKAIDREK